MSYETSQPMKSSTARSYQHLPKIDPLMLMVLMKSKGVDYNQQARACKMSDANLNRIRRGQPTKYENMRLLYNYALNILDDSEIERCLQTR